MRRKSLGMVVFRTICPVTNPLHNNPLDSSSGRHRAETGPFHFTSNGLRKLLEQSVLELLAVYEFLAREEWADVEMRFLFSANGEVPINYIAKAIE